jgi:hypothetical protein
MFHCLSVRHAHHHAVLARVSTTVLVAVTLLAASASIQAQPTARSARADPGDPTTRVPAVVYESSLTASQLPSEAPPSWRQANDTVARIGGWRAYAREAQQSAEPRVSSPPPQKAMSMHPGHGAHP